MTRKPLCQKATTTIHLQEERNIVHTQEKYFHKKMLDQKKIGLTSGVVTEDVKTKVHFLLPLQKKLRNTQNYLNGISKFKIRGNLF